ncbi:MAG: SUMF1/EgtB/PvdO family nonheme iron enzyme [Verrucomicrobiia bacterium]
MSWFEAAAYARFAGKALPTVHHWHLAACLGEAQVIIPHSNLGARSHGPAPVGSYPGMGHSGLYDMAGNVKEWCFNATDASGNRRLTLGGSWNEPTYVFGGPDSRTPWERSAEIGFRCAQFSPITSAVEEELLKPFRLPAWRDFSSLTPFSDDEFEVLREQHRYDQTLLNAETAEIDDRSVFWRKETITMDPAYSGDRLIAHLFLPKNGRPPFQTVIFFPGANAVSEKTFTGLPYGSYTESIIHSGRALLFPIYYGTYERPAALGRVWTFESVLTRPLAYRDWMIHMTKDLSRCIDYLETRDDIDHGQYAFYGMCHGAILGPILLAVEERIKAGVFALGGLVPIELPRSFDFALYAQRVRVPVLMVNGREDALIPWETSQKPLFERLKQGNSFSEYKPYPGGHGVLEGLFSQQIHQDVLAWLDRFLGPVAAERRRQPGQTQTTP